MNWPSFPFELCFASSHPFSSGSSFLRICHIAVCDFYFFHLTLQIETDFIFFSCIKIVHLISQARKKWLESFQTGPGELPKIILCLMDCPDCLYVWLGKVGAGKRDLGNKISLCPVVVSESDGWESPPDAYCDFLRVYLLGARFVSPSSWADPLGFLVNSTPSLCILHRLLLCANTAWINAGTSCFPHVVASLIWNCWGLEWLRKKLLLSRVGEQ
jgi:hypothetical protein